MPTLSDTAVRNAKPGEKPYKISDGDGLYLLVNATGKYWRFNYRFAGKQKTLALGVYPDLTLKAAREKLAEARRLLANDIDPSMEKRIQKAARREAATNSFDAVAREWFARHSSNWKESHASKIIARLERDVFPWIPCWMKFWASRLTSSSTSWPMPSKTPWGGRITAPAICPSANT